MVEPGHVGNFSGEFVLLIGSRVSAHLFALMGLLSDVLCSLCTLGGADGKAKGIRVRATRGSWQIGGFLANLGGGSRASLGFFFGVYLVDWIPGSRTSIWADGVVSRCHVLFVHTRGHPQQGKRS